jgi:hypothetical protein
MRFMKRVLGALSRDFPGARPAANHAAVVPPPLPRFLTSDHRGDANSLHASKSRERYVML